MVIIFFHYTCYDTENAAGYEKRIHIPYYAFNERNHLAKKKGKNGNPQIQTII
jgi:hypothetical protein